MLFTAAENIKRRAACSLHKGNRPYRPYGRIPSTRKATPVQACGTCVGDMPVRAIQKMPPPHGQSTVHQLHRLHPRLPCWGPLLRRSTLPSWGMKIKRRVPGTGRRNFCVAPQTPAEKNRPLPEGGGGLRITWAEQRPRSGGLYACRNTRLRPSSSRGFARFSSGTGCKAPPGLWPRTLSLPPEW